MASSSPSSASDSRRAGGPLWPPVPRRGDLVGRAETAAAAVAGITSGDRVFVHGGSAVPLALLDPLFARAGELFDARAGTPASQRGDDVDRSQPRRAYSAPVALCRLRSARCGCGRGGSLSPCVPLRCPTPVHQRATATRRCAAPRLATRRARLLLSRGIGGLRFGCSPVRPHTNRPDESADASNPRRLSYPH